MRPCDLIVKSSPLHHENVLVCFLCRSLDKNEYGMKFDRFSRQNIVSTSFEYVKLSD